MYIITRRVNVTTIQFKQEQQQQQQQISKYVSTNSVLNNQIQQWLSESCVHLKIGMNRGENDDDNQSRNIVSSTTAESGRKIK